MTSDSDLIKKLYQEALNEAKNVASGKISETTPPPPSPTRPSIAGKSKGHTSLASRWENRTPVLTTGLLKNFPLDNVLLTYKCHNRDLTQISRFDCVYSIVGDHLTAKPVGLGCYFCNITDSKYVKSRGNTTIYRGVYTYKTKTCQKTWGQGDIRSYSQIDDSVYKQYFNPLHGLIPSIVGASILQINSKHPSKQIVLYGVDLSELPAVDQQILKNINVKLCD